MVNAVLVSVAKVRGLASFTGEVFEEMFIPTMGEELNVVLTLTVKGAWWCFFFSTILETSLSGDNFVLPWRRNVSGIILIFSSLELVTEFLYFRQQLWYPSMTSIIY